MPRLTCSTNSNILSVNTDNLTMSHIIRAKPEDGATSAHSYPEPQWPFLGGAESSAVSGQDQPAASV